MNTYKKLKGFSQTINYQLPDLDRAPRPRKEFWELMSLLSAAVILCSSEELSSHMDCALHADTTTIQSKNNS